MSAVREELHQYLLDLRAKYFRSSKAEQSIVLDEAIFTQRMIFFLDSAAAINAEKKEDKHA